MKAKMMRERSLAFIAVLTSGAIGFACGNDNGGHLVDSGVFDATPTIDGGGGNDTGTDGGPGNCDTTATYTSIYNNVIKLYCSLQGCHVVPGPQGGLDMGGTQASSYTSLVNTDTVCTLTCSGAKTMFPKRIVPMNAAQSFLFEKVSKDNPANGTGGVRMPYGGQPLKDCEIAAIQSWINAGAMND
jgi:hypothetical protein